MEQVKTSHPARTGSRRIGLMPAAAHSGDTVIPNPQVTGGVLGPEPALLTYCIGAGAVWRRCDLSVEPDTSAQPPDLRGHSADRNIGAPVRSPLARSIARAVRGASRW